MGSKSNGNGSVIDESFSNSSSSASDEEAGSSSTSSDSEVEDKGVRKGPYKYDDANDIIITLDFDEENSTQKVELNEFGQLYCNICDSVFSTRTRYLTHRRRHFAPDHFICPTCSKGFVNLLLCQEHELNDHSPLTQSNCPPKSRKARNLRNTTLRNSKQYKEHIVPSTCLYPYVGPKVDELFKPYEIEVEYSHSEKKGKVRYDSERILILHRRAEDRTRERVLAAKRRLELKEKEAQREASKPQQGSSKGSQGILSNVEIHSPQVIRSGRRDLPDIISPCRKYYCSECEWNAQTKASLKIHIEDEHPGLPFEDVMERCSLLGVPPKSGHSNKRSKARKSAKKGGAPERNKRKERKDKKKKIKFAIRREAVRVWEKAGESLTQREFMSALGMVYKSDVLLGPRQGLRIIESSLFSFRRIRREKSPPPHARIVMKKLPPLETRHVHLCNKCDFIGSSTTEVRRHRRNEHLKNVELDWDGDPANRNKPPPPSETTNPRTTSSLVNSIAGPSCPRPISQNASPPKISTNKTSKGSDSDDSPVLYKCKRCNFSSENRREVKHHIREVHKVEVSSDSSGTSMARSLDRNVQPSLSSSLYKCEHCNFSTYLEGAFHCHQRTKHSRGGCPTNGSLLTSSANSTSTSKRLKNDFESDLSRAVKKPKVQA